jgi:hypothetical protein
LLLLLLPCRLQCSCFCIFQRLVNWMQLLLLPLLQVVV